MMFSLQQWHHGVLKRTKSNQAPWLENSFMISHFRAFVDDLSSYGAWTFRVARLSHPTCSSEWIRRRRWWSACPLHHLLIRVLALTAQNWINLHDPCCCFPSRGQPHITALSPRQRHALLNEILFLPLPPSCLSLCLYLLVAGCINPGVISRSSGLSDCSSLSSFWVVLDFCVITDFSLDRILVSRYHRDQYLWQMINTTSCAFDHR